MARTVGYLRVSTKDQDLEKNKAEILALANEKKLGHVTWVEEKVSGTKDWRKRELGRVVERLKAGDTIITSELSRLARSTLQILQVIEQCRRKGIAVYAIKGGWNLNGTMNSKILLAVFAMVAEIERDLISERTIEGLAEARARGSLLGRPKGPGKSKLDEDREEIMRQIKLGVPKTKVAKRFGTTSANLWLWLKKRGL
jgi:DNA invertase Pin-like site-specific DNA recombinase